MTPEQRREYQRKWRAANPDKVRAYNRIFRERHGPRKWTEHRADANRRWRAKNIDHLRAYWKRTRGHRRIVRNAWYLKNKLAIAAYKRERYKSDPSYREYCKNEALKHRQKYPEKCRQRTFNYCSKRRAELAAKAQAYYYKNREQIKRKTALMRERKREELRAWSKKRTASLCDSYIREQLAKYSPLSTKDFPPELVELKRQHMLARKELQKYEKHERTARHSL